MANTFLAPCKTKLKLSGTAIEDVRNISVDQNIVINKFGTSSTSCSKVAVTGSKDSELTFDVILSVEEFFQDDVLDIGASGTLTMEYYDPSGTLDHTRTMPIIISKISETVDLSEGTEITMSVTATSNGAWTLA